MLDQYRGLRLARLWRHVLLLWKSFLNFYFFSSSCVPLSLLFSTLAAAFQSWLQEKLVSYSSKNYLTRIPLW